MVSCGELSKAIAGMKAANEQSEKNAAKAKAKQLRKKAREAELKEAGWKA